MYKRLLVFIFFLSCVHSTCTPDSIACKIGATCDGDPTNCDMCNSGYFK